MYVWVPCIGVLGGQKRVLDPRSWNYRSLWTTMRVLEIRPKSSARGPCALNNRIASLPLQPCKYIFLFHIALVTAVDGSFLYGPCNKWQCQLSLFVFIFCKSIYVFFVPIQPIWRMAVQFFLIPLCVWFWLFSFPPLLRTSWFVDCSCAPREEFPSLMW